MQAEMLKLSLCLCGCLPFLKIMESTGFPLFLKEFSQVGLIVCEEDMTTPFCLIGSLQLTYEPFLITFQFFSFIQSVSARYNFSKIITALFLISLCRVTVGVLSSSGV